MQQSRSERLARIRGELVMRAGGYLRNVVRVPGATCTVCATPVSGYSMCYPCNQQSYTSGVANLVVPLVYGIKNQQSGNMLRHYKDDFDAGTRAKHRKIVSRTLFLGLVGHELCISRQVGQPVSMRMTVPSLGGREGVHPFHAIAQGLNAVSGECQLLPASGARSDRTVSADKFVMNSAERLDGHHVLLLDDTWTTGSRTQSAALTLRKAGASAVSVMVVGRWLEPGFAGNAAFIRQHLTTDYDPRVCPITGDACQA